MTEKEAIAIRNIKESISLVDKFTKGISRDDFLDNEEKTRAVTYTLSNISEEIKNIEANTRARFPSIDWRAMRDFGNRARHAYRGIDFELVWTIVEKHLPPLKEAMTILEKDHARRPSEPEEEIER